MDYEVKLPLFEGPFDLLLFFIERDELDIHEVSLSSITGDFLNYLHSMAVLNLELASEFIWVAATLMKIKARQLLPRPKTESETEDMDAEENLMKRLIEYRKYKNIIPRLQELENERNLQYKRGNFREDLLRINGLAKEGNSMEELHRLTLYQLLISYRKVLERNLKNKQHHVHTLISVPYTIESQKRQILQLIQLSKRIDFHTLEKKVQNKLELVYSFLAILELIQEQILQIQVGIGYNNFEIFSE